MKTLQTESPVTEAGKAEEVKVNFTQKHDPAPIINARVRYDGVTGSWAVIDKENKPTEHFEYGVLKNVRFESVKLKGAPVGCGPSNTMTGIATGDLQLHKVSDNVGLAHNLGFSDNGFRGQSGAPLANASEVILMPGRKAMYID